MFEGVTEEVEVFEGVEVDDDVCEGVEVDVEVVEGVLVELAVNDGVPVDVIVDEAVGEPDTEPVEVRDNDIVLVAVLETVEEAVGEVIDCVLVAVEV